MYTHRVRPKVVVFDLGNVLVDFDYRQVSATLAESCTVSPAEVHALIHDSGLLRDFEHGFISSSEFYSRFASGSGFKGGFEEFAPVFGDIFTPIEGTADMPGILRALGVRLCLLSNTNPLAVRYVRERFPFYGKFSDTVLSYEHGVMKPAEGLYEATEETTGCAGAELLFFDDREENVRTATKRGWQAHVYQTPDQLGDILLQTELLPPRERNQLPAG